MFNEAKEAQMESSLTLRQAGTADEAAIARVAALDSSRPPRCPALIGQVEGRIVAALSLDDGAVVADPFEHTADVVQALRLRRDQLRPDRSRHGRLRQLPLLRPATDDVG